MPLPDTLTELRPMYQAKSQELHEIFEKAGADLDVSKLTEGDFAGKSSTEKAVIIRKRNEELGEIKKAMEPLIDLERIREENAKAREGDRTPINPFVPPSTEGKGGPLPRIKSLGEIVAESTSYKAFVNRDTNTAKFTIPEATFKTLITLSSMQIQNERRASVIDMALETATVADLMLQGGTNSRVIEYYEETTVENNAATVSEGNPKPESGLAWTLRTNSLSKIATWIPATSESLRDERRMQSMIEGRLIYMIKRVEERQLLLGDGVAPNILGVQLRTGVQTQAKGADPVPDAIYKAMVLIETNAFADPTNVVIHPLDWQDIRLLRTADGVYIWGSPSEAGPERIWGLPIRKTTEQTQNTALVGAFRPWAEVIRAGSIDITVSTEHSDFFIKNKVAILAEEEIALAVYRPSAFCKVTGI